MLDADRRLLLCTFDSLPTAVQNACVVKPVLATPVALSGNGFRLLNPDELTKPVQQSLVPKLGVKSWRESGRLGVIYKGLSPIAVLEPLLRTPTNAQRLIAKAWMRNGCTLNVYLSPYVDFPEVTEARFLVQRGTPRLISVCLRGRSASHFSVLASQMSNGAKVVAQHLGPSSWIIDIALFPNKIIRLVEVNPALSPQELATLDAA